MKKIILLTLSFLLFSLTSISQSISSKEKEEIDLYDSFLRKHLKERNHQNVIDLMDQLKAEKGDEEYYNAMLIDLNEAKELFQQNDESITFEYFLDSLSGDKVTLIELAELEAAKTEKGAYLTIQDVPNQKLIDNSYISNPNNVLSFEAYSEINRICRELEDSTLSQVAVVVLNSIGSNVPHDFGVELFNYWGVGRSGFNDGLLILMVMDQRRVEFITGYGLESVVPDALAYEIQQNEMVPYFKQGDYNTGMINGVRTVANVILSGPDVESTSSTSVYSGYEYEKGEPAWYSFLEGYSTYLVIPALLLYVVFLTISLVIRNRYKRYKWMQLFTLLIFPILIPIPFLIIYFLNKKMMERWRNTIRISIKTGLPMVVLSEEGDDKYLSKGQQVEEKVKSIDYDVWRGENDEDLLILRYTKWFSKYSKCPKCSYKTYYLVYNRTIRAATYSSSGTGEKKYSCENCGHVRISTYTIPKLQKSSSSSSSGGYSSSSSGGSWGGGSSGGGGAGSSW